MNAFDLISKAGMLNLTKLLRGKKQSATANKMTLTCFTTRVSAKEILDRISAIIDNMLFFSFNFDYSDYCVRFYFSP